MEALEQKNRKLEEVKTELKEKRYHNTISSSDQFIINFQ